LVRYAVIGVDKKGGKIDANRLKSVTAFEEMIKTQQTSGLSG
jgi:hypothetical protein